MAALGFDAVDLILIEAWGLVSVEKLVGGFGRELQRVQDLLKKHGLTAVSVNVAFSPDLHDRSDPQANAARIERVVAMCRFMKAMGMQVGAHYPGHIADWKNNPVAVWRDTLESLLEIQSINRSGSCGHTRT